MKKLVYSAMCLALCLVLPFLTGQIPEMPAASVGPVVNTVGAGDALFSAFLHYFTKGMAPVEALQRAQIFAAKKIAVSGASMGFVSEKEIDEINILRATHLAMKRAVEKLKKVDFVLVDGLPNPRITLPSEAIVKGDNRSISIAAASIIAKVYRDKLMDEYDTLYPGYGFAANKGYPTEEHMQAVQQQGPCAIHRMTFLKKFYGEK